MIELKRFDRMDHCIRDEMIRQGTIDVWAEVVFDLDSLSITSPVLESQVWIATRFIKKSRM